MIKVKVDRIREADLPILSILLNAAWGSLLRHDLPVLRARFASGQLFVVARDHPTPAERHHLKHAHRLIVHESALIPLGILETIDLQTSGDPCHISRTYHSMTENGRWRTSRPDSDTLILVDLTVAESRRSEGIAGQLLRGGLLVRPPNLIHAMTYSPARPEVVAWHEHHGATSTGFRINGARPGHDPPDVIVMRYPSRAPSDTDTGN